LEELGYDTKAVARVKPSTSDENILKLANQEKRIIITNDKDFGFLVYSKRLPHEGVILFRLSTERVSAKKESLGNLLKEGINLNGKFVVIKDDKIRIRDK
jgi:predicted nuclease of predicted toxin-antitoxin system